MSPAGWLTRTGINSGTLRSAIEYWLPLLFYIWLFTLSQIKTICNPLAHSTWKCTTLTCEIPNLFLSDWRFALYLHFPYLRFTSLQIHRPTCVFRTCVFHPCEKRCFILAFSALAFSSTCVFSAPLNDIHKVKWRHNLWPRYDRHFVGIRRYNLWS